MRRGVDHSVTFCRPRESLFVRRFRRSRRRSADRVGRLALVEYQIVERDNRDLFVSRLAVRCICCLATRLYDSRRESPATLCQNCVTYPLKPWAHTVIYGGTSTR